MSLKVGILSLGCPRNLVDSETILGVIKDKNFKIVDEIQDSDIAIINTCSFIKEAKEESIEAVLDVCELKKQGKVKKIIVAGCLPQQYGDELVKELREVDAFIGRLKLSDKSKRVLITPKHFSYLKVAEGCDNRCSYCVIPKIKGKFTSRKAKDILHEIELFDKDKAIKELNIIGQDITNYGRDLKDGTNLSGLLKSILAKAKNIRWFRLLYLHPAHIDDELIELIAKEPRICKYIDLPIQHISNGILKKMNRKISRPRIISLIKKIRNTVPGVVIRTSLIVGFPSETEKEFQELTDFVKEIKFERLGAFIYSREEGAPAYNFKPQVSEKVKKYRFEKIMALQQEISGEFNRSLLGKNFDILIEERLKTAYMGRTYMDAPEVDGEVFVRGKNLRIGDFAKAKITDAYEYDLVAEAS